MGTTKRLGWVLAALCAWGCGDDSIICTAIGCGPALELTVQSEEWSPGEYAFDVTPETVDLTPLHCTLTVPNPSNEMGECTGPGSVFGFATLTLWYWDPVAGPAQVVVTRDGETLLDERVDPAYEASYPNGPDCGVCETATEMLTLP